MDTEREVIKVDEAALVPYEPGLSFESVTRGVLRRFLPGAGLIYGPLVALGAVFEPTIRSLLFPGFLGLVGGLGLGFGLGLAVLRKRLYPDAAVDGRRALLAGLLSPFALMAASALALPLIAGLSDAAVLVALGGAVLLVGFLMALVMFFPWLTPTPEEGRKKAESLGPGDDTSVLPGSASQ